MTTMIWATGYGGHSTALTVVEFDTVAEAEEAEEAVAVMNRIAPTGCNIRTEMLNPTTGEDKAKAPSHSPGVNLLLTNR